MICFQNLLIICPLRSSPFLELSAVRKKDLT